MIYNKPISSVAKFMLIDGWLLTAPRELRMGARVQPCDWRAGTLFSHPTAQSSGERGAAEA